MRFKKQELTNTHYTRNSEAHIFNGQPTSSRFDKNNGDQVLYLINFYASLAGRAGLCEGRIIEQTIARDLPDTAKREVVWIFVVLSEYSNIVQILVYLLILMLTLSRNLLET